jgi:hypothetical protein
VNCEIRICGCYIKSLKYGGVRKREKKHPQKGTESIPKREF